MIFAALIQTPPDVWYCCLVMVFVCVCASLNVLGMKQQLHILENDNWSPRTYSGSMKVYWTISKHPTRLSGFFSMSSVDCKNAENAKWMTFWLSCPWKHETLKRLCKSVFSGTSELPASRCKCTYIDRCTYLSSICTFKNPDVSTMYYNLYISNLSNTFFFWVADVIKNSFFWAIQSPRTFHQPISVKTAAVGLENLIMDFQSELIQGYENNTSIPKHSMYGIFTYKYHKYTIHIQYPYIECLE